MLYPFFQKNKSIPLIKQFIFSKLDITTIRSSKTVSYGDTSLQDLQEDYQLYIIWLRAFYTKIMIKISSNNIFNSTSLLKATFNYPDSLKISQYQIFQASKQT